MKRIYVLFIVVSLSLTTYSQSKKISQLITTDNLSNSFVPIIKDSLGVLYNQKANPLNLVGENIFIKPYNSGGIDGQFLRTDGTGNVSWSDPNSNISFNNQTTDYILALSDIGKIVQTNNAVAINLTVPPSSTTAFPIGTIIYVQSVYSNTTTFVPGSGVTITSTSGGLTDAGANVIMTLIKTNTDTWSLQNGNSLSFTSFSSTVTGFSSVSNNSGFYSVLGKIMFLRLTISGTSNSTSFSVTIPFNAAYTGNIPISCTDNGSGVVGTSNWTQGSNVITIFTTPNGGAWTNSGTKGVRFYGLSIPIQ